MEELFPALIIIIFGLVRTFASKKKQQAAIDKHKSDAAVRAQAAQDKMKSFTSPPAAPASVMMPAPAMIPAQPLASPAAPMVSTQPTVHAHVQPDCDTHDKPGSLGVTSTEGKDPCHEDQLTLERTFAEPTPAEGGLTFDWSGENMVKAFVMQEVLTRPAQRRAR